MDDIDALIDDAIYGDAPDESTPLDDSKPDVPLHRTARSPKLQAAWEDGSKIRTSKAYTMRADYARSDIPPQRAPGRKDALLAFAAKHGVTIGTLKNMIVRYNFEQYRKNLQADAEALLDVVGDQARQIVDDEISYAVQQQVPKISAAAKVMEDATKKVSKVLQAKESSGTEWDKRHREKLEEFVKEMDNPKADMERLAKKIAAYKNIISMERLLNEKSLTGVKRQNKPRQTNRIEDPGEAAALEAILDDEPKPRFRLVMDEDSA